MKKTIKDLRIGDTVFMFCHCEPTKELRVVGISERKLEVKHATGYPRLSFEMTPEDFSRWTFKSTEKYPETVYLEKLDALKARQKSLDARLISVFRAQTDFLKSLQELNDKIRKNDFQILEETKKK